MVRQRNADISPDFVLAGGNRQNRNLILSGDPAIDFEEVVSEVLEMAQLKDREWKIGIGIMND
jgi:hypothetical protein